VAFGPGRWRTTLDESLRPPRGAAHLTVGVGGAVTAELQASLAVRASCLPSTGDSASTVRRSHFGQVVTLTLTFTLSLSRRPDRTASRETENRLQE
jgi:hypothetical protein